LARSAPTSIARDLDAFVATALLAYTVDPVLRFMVGSPKRFVKHVPALQMIGVDPARQGRGLGSALLHAAVTRIDAAGDVAFVQCSNSRNVRVYERFGFEAIAQVRVSEGAVLTPMIRTPQG
jgi:ribosomal protein S18 acetylase RimI-like enzyme